ncbi:hypothetical protein MMC25_001469 [Agyrium rufum]|nr:hypothetical protein [Agyrium rufum]
MSGRPLCGQIVDLQYQAQGTVFAGKRWNVRCIEHHMAKGDPPIQPTIYQCLSAFTDYEYDWIINDDYRTFMRQMGFVRLQDKWYQDPLARLTVNLDPVKLGFLTRATTPENIVDGPEKDRGGKMPVWRAISGTSTSFMVTCPNGGDDDEASDDDTIIVNTRMWQCEHSTNGAEVTIPLSASTVAMANSHYRAPRIELVDRTRC